MKKTELSFQPNNNWYLVDPESIEQKFGTSFVSADDQVKKPMYGTIVAAHPAQEELPVGTRIFFQGSGIINLEVDEVDYILVNKQQILGSWKTI